MADQNLTQLTQITEAQRLASILLYSVIDPSGSPADVKIPLGALTGEHYKIVPSVASNNLTVKITHLDGTDPSSTNPLVFKVGDNWQIVTSNLSFTKNAGTNWCGMGNAELAALPHDLFVYIIEETGAAAGTKLGFARWPAARQMGDCGNTSTADLYMAGGWTNFTSGDVVRPIGKFRATMSAAASYNWSSPGTVVNYPVMESDWLGWTPQYSASGSMTYTSVTTDMAQYRVNGRVLEFEIKAHGTTGGSASNTLQATHLFSATNGAHNNAGMGYVADPSTVISGICALGTTILYFSKYDNSNFGLGAGRYLSGTGQFRFA